MNDVRDLQNACAEELSLEECISMMNVIFVGDLLQLPPVNGASGFEKWSTRQFCRGA